MLITRDIPDAEKYVIFDCRGSRIPYVISFDTETCEIELAVRVFSADGNVTFLSETTLDGTPSETLIKFVLRGAYAEIQEISELPSDDA